MVDLAILLDLEEARPGDMTYGQIIFEEPVVVMTADHFVVRSYSPITTIGGGRVLDSLPRKHKRMQAAVMEECRLLDQGSDEERVGVITARAGYEGIGLARLIMQTGLGENRLRKIIEAMLSSRRAVLLEPDSLQIVAAEVYAALQQQTLAELRGYHERNPLREGVQKEELRMTIGSFLPVRLFNKALKDLEKAGKLVLEKEALRLPEHRVHLQEELGMIRERLLNLYLQAGLAPPTVKEALGQFPSRQRDTEAVLAILLRENSLVKINEDLYYHHEVLDRFQEDYRRLLLRDGKATPASFKELTGLSRKFIIPLMEYFDFVKLTVRSGDHRILRERR